MSDSATIAKNTLSLFTGEVVAHILGLFITIILARYLGDAGFGIYSFAFAFASIMVIFSDLGISTLMVRDASRNQRLLNKYASNILFIKSILTIGTALAIVIIINSIQNQDTVINSVYWASAAMLLLEFSFFFRRFLHVKQIMEYEAIIKILEKVVTFALVGLFVLLKGLTILSAVIAFFLAYLFTMLTSFYFAKTKVSFKPTKIDLKFCSYLLKNSWVFWLATVFTVIYFKIDTVMLSFMTNYAAVGWYNAAYKLIEGLNFIPTLFIVAIFPAMSVLFVKNKKYLSVVFEKAVYYLLLIAIPLGIGISLLAHRFILLFYTSEYAPAIGALQILIWAEVFVFINYFLGFLLNSVDKQKLFTITIFIGLIVNIILNLLLIPLYGIYGAAFATLVTEILNFIMLFSFSSKSGYTFNILKTVYKPLLASIAMTLVVYLIYSVHILIIIPIAIIVYFLALYLIKGIGRAEFELFTKAVRKLR